MPAENRLAVLLSAPLALQRRGGSGHEGGGRFVPVPSLDFERERRLLVASLREGCRETGRNIEARAGSASPPPPRARFDPIIRRGHRLRLRHARARGAAAPPPSLPSPGRHPFLTVLTSPRPSSRSSTLAARPTPAHSGSVFDRSIPRPLRAVRSCASNPRPPTRCARWSRLAARRSTSRGTAIRTSSASRLVMTWRIRISTLKH